MKKLRLAALIACISFAANIWAASAEVKGETIFVAVSNEDGEWKINSKPGCPGASELIEKFQLEVVSRPRPPKPPQQMYL